MNKDKLTFLKKQMEENYSMMLESLDAYHDDRERYDGLLDNDKNE